MIKSSGAKPETLASLPRGSKVSKRFSVSILLKGATPMTQPHSSGFPQSLSFPLQMCPVLFQTHFTTNPLSPLPPVNPPVHPSGTDRVLANSAPSCCNF